MGFLTLTPNPIAIAIKPMRVCTNNLKSAVGNIATIEIRWSWRDANRWIGAIALNMGIEGRSRIVQEGRLEAEVFKGEKYQGKDLKMTQIV